MEKSIRVLQLTGTMNCGGTENMLMAIYRHIDRSRFEFSFLVHTNDRRPGFFDKEIRDLGGTIHHIGSQRKLGPWRYLSALRGCLAVNGPYDVVHSNLDWLGGLAVLGARMGGVPKRILHIHAAKLSAKGVSARAALLTQKLLIRRCATDYCGCSRNACNFLFGKSAKCSIIPNAIALDRYSVRYPGTTQQYRAEWGCSPDTRVLVHAGSFSTNKNQHFLIEVASCLKREMDFRLVLAGNASNEYGEQARHMVRELGLEREVLFLGLRQDLPEIFSASDLFLFPSGCEGFGIVAIEAQAAGLPCLLSPGIPREVDMGAGVTHWIETMEPKMWADTIARKQCPRPPQPDILNAIRSKGFDISQTITAIEQLYQGCTIVGK